MTDGDSTARCERCSCEYPLTRNKDGTPRKRKHYGFCRKCLHALSDAKWGALGKKDCRVCGEEFTLMEISQKVCSRPCRTAWVSFLSLVNQENRSCTDCGKPFSVHRDSRVYECAPCYAKNRRLAKLQAMGRSSFSPSSQPCEHCSAKFVRDAPGKAYCSPACRYAAKRLRQKETESFYVARRTRDSKRRALKRTTQVEKINPLEVFERDGYVCHLCGEETNRNAGNAFKRQDPKAPELEHIIALTEGGTHTWDNVACSCRACNAAKGAKSYGQMHLPFGPRRLWPELAKITAC